MINLTEKKWQELENRLLHITVENVTSTGEELTVLCYIHELNIYFEFNTDRR